MRDDSGQALAEYGILLALTTGFGRLSRLAHTVVTEQPITTLLVGAGLVILLGYGFGGGRRR